MIADMHGPPTCIRAVNMTSSFTPPSTSTIMEAYELTRVRLTQLSAHRCRIGALETLVITGHMRLPLTRTGQCSALLCDD